jgi:hypothetical protein
MSSINIHSMTGQSQLGLDRGAKWLGVEDAPRVQKRILEEVKKVNAHSGRF